LGSGVQGSWLASDRWHDSIRTLATPYGVADMSAVGVFTGNQKKRHRPIERNVIRSDFHSGLPINVINGGVKLPDDASPVEVKRIHNVARLGRPTTIHCPGSPS
jgi:hypothetical protein